MIANNTSTEGEIQSLGTVDMQSGRPDDSMSPYVNLASKSTARNYGLWSRRIHLIEDAGHWLMLEKPTWETLFRVVVIERGCGLTTTAAPYRGLACTLLFIRCPESTKTAIHRPYLQSA